VRAGGVENGGRLDRGESNDRARPAFRSLRRAGRALPLGMERQGRQPFIALAEAAEQLIARRQTSKLRDCEARRWRLLSSGDLSAHEPDQTVTISISR
jgi:hypothetical protein